MLGRSCGDDFIMSKPRVMVSVETKTAKWCSACSGTGSRGFLSLFKCQSCDGHKIIKTKITSLPITPNHAIFRVVVNGFVAPETYYDSETQILHASSSKYSLAFKLNKQTGKFTEDNQC